MGRSTAYYTLIGSLPALPRHFEKAERLPISDLRLQERLKMLEPEDADVVERIRDFLIWERQPLEQTDENVIRHADQLIRTVQNQFARELIHRVITVRSIIAALRCRRLGLDPPPAIAARVAPITRHWTHPDFRLGHQFPWIREFDERLTGGTAVDVEHWQLQISWERATRLADQYHFTLEAVVLYLIRREIIGRWIRHDAEAGRETFERLADQALGEYADMFGTRQRDSSGADRECND